MAAWDWWEPRTPQDFNVVADIPLNGVVRLSAEQGKRDMLVPAEIILESILERRADIPISAIHVYSGYKADLYPMRAEDELRHLLFEGGCASTWNPS